MKFIVKVLTCLYLISSCYFINVRRPRNIVDFINNLYESKDNNLQNDLKTNNEREINRIIKSNFGENFKFKENRKRRFHLFRGNFEKPNLFNF